MGETAVEQAVKIDDSTEQTEKVGTPTVNVYC